LKRVSDRDSTNFQNFNVLTIVSFSCIYSCMAIKTISLELDAYEKLKRAKRGKESFSAVVRRARFDGGENTGESILRELKSIYGAKRKPVAKATLDYWDKAEKEDSIQQRTSPSKWDE